MMAMDEKPTKTKRKKSREKAAEEEADDEASVTSNNSGDIGRRLADIQQSKKARGGLRPLDDKTREISIDPPKGPSSSDEEGDDDDDSKHYDPEMIMVSKLSHDSAISPLTGLSQDSGISMQSIISKRVADSPNPEPYLHLQAGGPPMGAAHGVAQLPPLHPPLFREPSPPVYYAPPPGPIQYGRSPPEHYSREQLNPSPSLTQGGKKKKARNKKQEAKEAREAEKLRVQQEKEAEKQRVQQEKDAEKKELARLEPIVLQMKLKNKERFICREEYGPASDGGQNSGDVLVAKYIELGSKDKGNYERVDIERFNYRVVRRIAANLGCKNASASSKFACRRAISLRLTSGTVYDLEEIVNPVTEASAKKVNTYVRVINACFLPEFVERFVHLNDAKQRKDYEKARGGNPIKAFWIDVSETVNDTENEDVKIISYAHENGDETIWNYAKRGIFRPVDFNQTTFASCSQVMKDITKAHEQVRAAMTSVSGEHCNDMTKFLNPVLLKVREGCIVPGPPVYYYAKLAEDHPAIEGSWNVLLAEGLMSTSTTKPSDTSDCKGSATASASSLTTTTKGSNKAEILEAIRTTNTILSSSTTTEEDRDRSAMFQAKTKLAEQNHVRQLWKEYDEWGERIASLKERGGSSIQLLRNLAIRVRSVEEEIGIPGDSSIVKEYLG